jgi:hypothetical protein
LPDKEITMRNTTILSNTVCIVAIILLPGPMPAAPKPPQQLPKPALAKKAGPGLWPKASYTDIQQGAGDTCWILASIAALEHSGRHLEGRIVSLGNNYYQVPLYNWKDWLHRPTGGFRVETEKVYFDGTTTSADPKYDPKDPHSAWVVIMQRVIQAIHDYDSSQLAANPHSGWAGDALGVLTGKATKTVGAQDANVQKIILGALKSNTIVMGTNGNAKTLVAGHSYAVIGSYNEGLVLYNPWGSPVKAPWSLIQQEGGEFEVD